MDAVIKGAKRSGRYDSGIIGMCHTFSVVMIIELINFYFFR